MFKNRTEAGKILASHLLPYKIGNVVVLGIPRGGIPVASEVAKSIRAPIDVVLSKKIGHPFNKEYAIGAVSLEEVIINSPENFPDEYIKDETRKIRELLANRYQQYHTRFNKISLKNKTVIIVDDGIATGTTLLSTINLVNKQQPEEIIVAIPVAPVSAINMLKNSTLISKVICLETPPNFNSVGQFYDNFQPICDENAIAILEKTNRDYFNQM